MNSQVEKKLQITILPELEMGRPNWDKPHTKAVVYYVKEIIKANPDLELDEDILIIAAYAHDWGYAGLFKNGVPASLDAVQSHKAQHMDIGKQKVHALLKEKEFDYLTFYQKQRIEHLVFTHDKLANLSEIDGLILMEADTLGAADVDAVKPTFNEDDYIKWKNETKTRRVSRFVTNYSKRKIEDLFQKSSNYLSSKRSGE